MKAIKLILLSVLLIACGSIFLKLGANELGIINLSNLKEILPIVITNIYLIIGVLLYGLSSFTWLLAISKTDLSKAYPILALAYGLIPILSWLVFGDNMSLLRWVGISIIFLGVMLMARS